MNNTQQTLSAADLLKKLAEHNYLESNGNEKTTNELAHFIQQKNQHSLPLYLNILIGLGAFIAALCFTGLVAIGIVSTGTDALLIWGLLFMAMAIGTLALSEKSAANAIKHSFLLQTSFAFMATGKILFVAGFVYIFDQRGNNWQWSLSAALLMITCASYPLYRVTADRFISSLASLISILISIIWHIEIGLFQTAVFNSYIAAQLLALGLLIVHSKTPASLTALNYALMLSLSLSTLYLMAPDEWYFLTRGAALNPLYLNLAFTASLLASVLCLFRANNNNFNPEAIVISCIGIIALGLLSAPGIALAIMMLLWGYEKHERGMITLGILLIACSLFFYYYQLDFSLIKKSGILIGSGLILLAGHLVIKFKAWDKGVKPCAQN